MKIKSKKSKGIFILLAILAILTGLRLVWYYIHTPIEHPIATDGVLDLRDYEWNLEDPITLSGEWSYVPNQLIGHNPEKTQGRTEDISGGNQQNEDNYGTYSLNILLPEDVDLTEIFTITLPSAKTASALYINGDLQKQSGNVAEEDVKHKGKGNQYDVSFVPEVDEVTISIEISNFDTSEGMAIGSPIKFGTLQAINSSMLIENILVISMVVILVFYSIYSLIIFLFIKRNKIFLFFAIGFLFPALDELLTYNSAAMEWLHLNYNWSYKFNEFVYLGAVFLLIHLMRILLKNFGQYQRFKWLSLAYGISAVLIIVLPLDYLMQVNLIFFLLYFVSFLAVVPLALKEYFEYRNESIFIAIIIIGATSGIFWGLVKEIIDIEIPFYPFDYLLLFIAFGVFWLKRFHRQNEQVIELVDELEQADQRKDEFLANTSHELRNPLHGVINIAQTILDDKEEPLSKKHKENLELLVGIGKQLTSVLNDLQDFTQLKDHEINLDKTKVNLPSTVTAVVEMLHFISMGRNIDFKINIPKDFPMVDADPNRFIQILFNLIHNAIKYTNNGSVSIEAKQTGEIATISVKDTGIGIHPEMIDKIFQPYFQEDGSITSSGSGIGLGLSICKKLVELHGGTLSVESRLGEGSTFSFTIGLASANNIQSESKLSETRPIDSNQIFITNSRKQEVPTMPSKKETSKRAKVLVVDDDPINLKILKDMLSGDYDMETARGGKEALPLIHDQHWDLIISDVMMPEMSGYELTQKIRETYSLAELPVLLLTARNNAEDVYTGFISGANDYVAKPIVALEFKARVEVLTQLKQSVTEQLKMEAAWLQAQIQPHFIFNTLNAIASLSDIDITRMHGLLDEFANYLRRSFHIHTTESLIPLGEELELTRSYLYIEKERFQDKLKIDWDINDVLDLEIPPLTIQPIVENAVKHGVLKKLEGGTISITIKELEHAVYFNITDDGVGMTEERRNMIVSEKPNKKIGIGVSNTNSRLKRMYGKGLIINSKQNEGTTVEFQIPKQSLI